MALRTATARGTPDLAASRIDAALAEFADASDPETVERVEDLIRTLMEFYGASLSRLVEQLNETDTGAQELRRIASDKVVGALLVLHDLHPASTVERVRHALETVRPYLGSHAGDVELLDVNGEGVVRLRLAGNCNGCPSSSATVSLAIEHAIEDAAPEVTCVEVEGMTSPSPVSAASHGAGPGGRTLLPVLGAARETPSQTSRAWVTLADPTAYAPDTIARTTVGGVATVVANVDGALYAYRDRCPLCDSPLHRGILDQGTLRCDGCATSFDVRRAGRDCDGGDLHLEPLPLLTFDNEVKVAVAGL
jgi:Fe-S cluster biogenesis protein NfuA/nitrite reductase/ring-hydroxylating ferredoxin subunit